MASEVTQNSNAALAAALVNQAIEENRPAMAAVPLCRIKSIEGMPTLAEKFPILPTSPAVASSISDGTAMGNTGLTPTSVTITAAAVGLGGVITDQSQTGSIITDAVALGYFARGVMEKYETDTTALFTSFTTNTTVGSSGVAMSLANWQTAQYELELARTPGRYAGILHTIQLLYLRSSLVSAAAGIWANPSADALAGVINQVGNTALKGVLLGTPVYQSPTCVTANANVDRVGAMFQVGDDAAGQGAIGFLWKWPVRIETIRQPMMPGTQGAATAAYGVNLLMPLYGVKIVNLGT